MSYSPHVYVSSLVFQKPTNHKMSVLYYGREVTAEVKNDLVRSILAPKAYSMVIAIELRWNLFAKDFWHKRLE